MGMRSMAASWWLVGCYTNGVMGMRSTAATYNLLPFISILFLRLIHVDSGNICCSVVITVWLHHHSFIYSPLDGCLGCSPSWFFNFFICSIHKSQSFLISCTVPDANIYWMKECCKEYTFIVALPTWWRISPGQIDTGGAIGKTQILFLNSAKFLSNEVFSLFSLGSSISKDLPCFCSSKYPQQLVQSKSSVCVSQIWVSKWMDYFP